MHEADYWSDKDLVYMRTLQAYVRTPYKTNVDHTSYIYFAGKVFCAILINLVF